MRNAAKFEELADLGYTDVWSAESDAGGVSPRCSWRRSGPRRCASARRSCLRSPACAAATAQSVALVAASRPGTVRLRHRHVVERDRRAVERRAVRRAVQACARHGALPAGSVDGGEGRSEVRHLRGAGSSVSASCRRCSRRSSLPRCEGMLRLAGREGDGAIINWLSSRLATSPRSCRMCTPVAPTRRFACRILVAPLEDVDTVRAAATYAIART